MSRRLALALGFALLAGIFAPAIWLHLRRQASETTLPAPVRRPGAVPQDAEAPRPTAPLVRGRLMRDKPRRPITGATIELQRNLRRFVADPTDRDGLFQLRVPDLGHYGVYVRLSREAPPHRLAPLEVRSAEDGIREVYYDAGPEIAGRVVTWDRRPPREATLELLCQEHRVLSEKRPLLLDPAGRFSLLVGSARGTVRAVVTSPGYGPSATLDLAVADKDLAGLEFLLPPGTGVGGRVVDEGGKPVVQAGVRLFPLAQEGDGSYRAATNEEGRFLLAGVAAGKYGVSVDVRGYVLDPACAEVEVTTAGPSDLLLRLSKGWSVSGRVIDQDGKPVIRAGLEARAGGRRYYGRSGKDGRFKIEGIAPVPPTAGSAVIEVVTCSAKGFSPLSRQSVLPGEEIAFVLQPGGVMEIRVTLPEGPAPPEFPWMILCALKTPARPLDKIPPQRLQMAKGERLFLSELPAGFYDLQVSAVGRESVVIRNISVQPGQTAVVNAKLFPGSHDDIPAASLTLSDPVQLKRELSALLDGLTSEGRKEFLEDLRRYCDGMPEKSGPRSTLEQALREFK